MLSNTDAAHPLPPSSGIPSFPIGLSIPDVDPLTQSEARFRALAQATGQIYWIGDAEGHPTDLTAWCAFTGQTLEEATGTGWIAALHPDDRERNRAIWASALATRQPIHCEGRLRRADGEYRTMLMQAYPVLDAEGVVQEWVGVNMDVSLLQELRAEVQASQEEFRVTFEQAAVGMAHVRPDGRILRANKKLCEILGYSHEELLGYTFQELTYPADLDTNLMLLERLLAGEISTYTLEKRYMRKDGSLVWATLTSSLKRDQAGVPQYGIAVVENISARKAAEEALRQSEQQYRQLFEAMTQGVIYYSASGEILSANPAALRMLELTQEQIKKRSPLNPGLRIIREDGSFCPSEALPTVRALRTGHTVSDVIAFFKPMEQTYRWLQVTAIPEFQPGEQTPYRVFAIFEDITRRRRLEEELRTRIQEWETLFLSLNEGVIAVGADGRILRANPAYAALVGWPAGSAFYNMPPEERHRALHIRDEQGRLIPLDQFVTARLLRGETVAEENIIRNRDGRDVYTSVRGAPLSDAAGCVIGAVLVLHDVTERRKLEEELRTRVQEWETIFASLSEGLIVVGDKGQVLRVNPAYAALVGWPVGSAMYTMPPEERYRTLHIRDEQGQLIPTERLGTPRLLREEVVAEEQIFRRQDGRDVYVSVRGAPLSDAAGRVIGAVLILYDVTERRKLEEELRTRVQEWETIFASLSEGLIVVGDKGQVLRVNPAYAALVGWPDGSSIYTMSPEERYRALHIRDEQGRPIPFDQFATLRLLHGETVADERILRNRDGRDMYASIRAAPLTDAAGHVTGGVLILHDNTAQRRLEHQTRAALEAMLKMAEALVQRPPENEEQRSLLVEQHLAELACSLLDCPVAIIITLDPQTLEMQVLATVGYPPEQETQLHAMIASWTYTTTDLTDIARLMAGETLVLDLTQPPYQEYAAVFEARQAVVAPMQLGGHLIGIVVFNPSKLTQVFTRQQIALAGATAQLVGLVVERDRLLREREEARARALALDESNRQMDTFLGMVSHELRTPLAVMKMSIQLIQRRLERAFSSAPEVEKGLAVLMEPLQGLLAPAERQIARLERLVKDLLDASRIKEGQLELRLERADLSAIVQAVVTEQRELTPERVIRLHAPADQPLFVQVDDDLIRQAVMNYLTNALKYSPETAPVLVGVERASGQARVWVRDQGPGIIPADQERIWDRFYRVPGVQEQSDAVGGLGLGLYVTRMLIEQHQGQVGMSSTPGQGTTFWFTLPLAP